jgi:uncharacterized protein
MRGYSRKPSLQRTANTLLSPGADTALGGYFKGVDLTDPRAAATRLAIGTRVVTRFAEQRKGDVLDFWFEPA